MINDINDLEIDCVIATTAEACNEPSFENEAFFNSDWKVELDSMINPTRCQLEDHLKKCPDAERLGADFNAVWNFLFAGIDFDYAV